MRIFPSFAMAVPLLCCALSVQAQEASYPARPITLVVPAAAGGSNSVIARLIAEKLQGRLGQSVIVDNKPGANTSIGTAFVARSKPDGYTLLISGASTFNVNPLLYRSLPYKAQDFEYVAYTGQMPLVLMTNPKTGFSTLSDVVAEAKSKPGILAYASFGNGSMPHLAGEALAYQAGISLVHVPYKGSAPGMSDLIGNQIPLSFDTLTAALPMIKGNKVVPLAVTSSQPSAQLPGTPTVESAGFADYDFYTWFAIAAPKGTPDAIVKRLGKEVEAVMALPEIKQALLANGIEDVYMKGEAVLPLIEAQQARLKNVIERANIKIE
ncbi:Bug family tripartite tricarboxylate transporter substrate binding protein [Orrella dioscoreae]|uniref:Tricarboxylate transport protein TctC n=2 Tax=root TaxID=1 RepID=A0A1C3K8R1_9BURK|nr:tripartite tricarboxylate transporter substrate binding protein [Orrella dioscoreae]SBT27808.1 Tricarboxylate transport protein TctC [Orrella dioscoreae]SOE49297.1 Tricarboxylate transport protein TctC [Orrella dioscoreae]